MKRIWLLLLSISIFMLGGCAKEQIADIDIRKLDWDKISVDIDAKYIDAEKYPQNTSINYNLNDEGDTFSVILFVEEDTTPEIAVSNISEVVKGLNDMVAEQESSVKRSTDTYFGSFYKNYDLYLLVIPGNPDTSEENYLVEQKIPAGEYAEITSLK